MTILKPAPVSILQFSFSKALGSFTVEMSSTNGFGRTHDDACDVGLTVIGTTGREIVFVVNGEHRDGEGDLTHWTLHSTCGTYTMVVFND